MFSRYIKGLIELMFYQFDLRVCFVLRGLWLPST